MAAKQQASGREIRAFIACAIPQGVRESVREAQRRWKAELPRARWVDPGNQHLTLKFLGDCAEGMLDELAASLAPALSSLTAVKVELGGTGFFPNISRPRVAWIGGRAAGANAVVDAVEDAAASFGIARENRPWSLHLTQARLRDPWPSAAVQRFMDDGDRIALEPFTCTEVILYSSRLEPTGAVYTALERFDLRC